MSCYGFFLLYLPPLNELDLLLSDKPELESQDKRPNRPFNKTTGNKDTLVV